MNAWATRCNACGTSFRVSEDQLKISDGFVRCGRCDAVFDARSSLFDLDAMSAPVPLQSAPMPLQPLVPTAAVSAPVSAPVSESVSASAEAPTPADEPVWQDDADTPPAFSAVIGETEDWSMPDSADARAEPVWADPPSPALSEDEAQARLRELLGAAPGATLPSPASATNAPAEPAVFASLGRRQPSPVGRSTRYWNAFGGLLAGLLTLALPLQWAWIEREALRARLPWLDTLLAERGLSSSGWRQLEGLSVGGSSLQATPQGAAYRLELVLHNRAAHRVAMPWLDLRLSDAGGAVLMRRALPPGELDAPLLLQAGEQRRLQAVFRLNGGAAAVNGYEIGLFHP